MKQDRCLGRAFLNNNPQAALLSIENGVNVDFILFTFDLHAGEPFLN